MKKLIPSLPQPAHLSDVFRAFPATVRPLLEYHDILLRGDSDLSRGQRELIAAYVSGLNACAFCFGAHKIAADAFGIAPALIDALIQDIDATDIDPAMKPILHYVHCLTLSPAKMTEAHSSAVYAAGWSEAALYDAVQVCALYNFMNRIVEGSGVNFDTASLPPMSDADKEKRRARSYCDWGRAEGLIDD